MATASELDAALLASINPRWTKVAMVFGRAEQAPGLSFDEEGDIFEALAERLRELVASGQVLAQGDLKDWRFSEVRIPTIAVACRSIPTLNGCFPVCPPTAPGRK